MGLIRRIKQRIMPGPVHINGSLGLRGAGASVSAKLPFLKRRTIFRKEYRWR